MTGSFMAAVIVVVGAYVSMAVNPQTHPAVGLYVAYGLLLWAVLSIVLACFFTWQKKYDECR